MTPFDRRVRASIYQLLVDQVREVRPEVVAAARGLETDEVSDSFKRLAEERRLVLAEDGVVRMAHPFSGTPTGYRACIGDDWWHANCAWDGLAILALLGDGEVVGPRGPLWRTMGGQVSPNGPIHLTVPARAFWDDVGFT